MLIYVNLCKYHRQTNTSKVVRNLTKSFNIIIIIIIIIIIMISAIPGRAG